MAEIGMAAGAMDNADLVFAEEFGIARRQIIRVDRQQVGAQHALPLQMLDRRPGPQSDMSFCLSAIRTWGRARE